MQDESRNPITVPLYVACTSLVLALVGLGYYLQPTRAVHGQQAAQMQLQTDGPIYSGASFTLPSGYELVAPFNVTFPTNSVTLAGNYAVSVAVPSSVLTTMGVSCRLLNGLDSSARSITTAVTAAGSVTATLNVSSVITVNSTPVIGRCFAY